MVGDEKVVVTHKPFGPRQAPASSQAAIAQLGERQTEDLKVPSSILGLGIFVGQYIGEFGRAYLCSRLSCGTDSNATEQ